MKKRVPITTNVFLAAVWLLPALCAGQQRPFSSDWSTLGVYRGSVTSYRPSLFNPDGFSVRTLDFPEHQASLLQQVAWTGVRGPLALSASWRGEISRFRSWEARGRITGLTAEAGLGRWVVMAGRSFIRWGTGYAFNPTDFVAPAKSPADPENRDGRQNGRDLLKLEYFGDRFSAAACLLFSADRSLPDWNDPAAAFRLYTSLGSLDLSLLAHLSGRGKPMVGANASLVLGDRLELHGELLLDRNARASAAARYLRSAGVDVSGSGNAAGPVMTMLLGFQVTLPGNMLLITEYFHSGAGMEPEVWKGLTDHLETVAEGIPAHPEAVGSLLRGLLLIQTGRSMQDYLFTCLDVPATGTAALRSVLLLNLSDGSSILIPELNLRLKNSFTLFCRGCIFQGGHGSEYGEIFQSYVLEGGVRFTR
ncbi:hypothetical protein JXO52_03640 [bacterium]|nr:hypothetical protein [bacterium]